MGKSMKKYFIMALIISFCSQLIFPIIGYAKEEENSTRGYDIRTKEHTDTINFSKSMVSIDPSIAAESAPDYIRTVDFTVTLTGYLHYDAITGRYVSASSPTATLNYQGKVALSWQSFSTSYHDNGDSVTFSFNGRLVGTNVADSGVYCSMDYGNVSGSYTVDKY